MPRASLSVAIGAKSSEESFPGLDRLPEPLLPGLVVRRPGPPGRPSPPGGDRPPWGSWMDGRPPAEVSTHSQPVVTDLVSGAGRSAGDGRGRACHVSPRGGDVARPSRDLRTGTGRSHGPACRGTGGRQTPHRGPARPLGHLRWTAAEWSPPRVASGLPAVVFPGTETSSHSRVVCARKRVQPSLRCAALTARAQL